jgi:hypothetical protein
MDAPYELRRLTSMEWVILDLSLSEHDPRRTVACIYEVDTLEFDVIWLRDLGLAGKYAAPEEVLEAVVRVGTRRRRSQRPVPIPHVPPAEEPIAV